MSRIKAGEAYVEVSVKGADRVELALSKIQKTAGAVNSAVKRLAASFAGLNNTVAYAFRNISSFAADFGTIGDVYDKASGRLGISAQALSEFDFAAQRRCADLGAVEGAVKNIQKKLAEAQNGSESAASAFEQLGLSVSEIAAFSTAPKSAPDVFAACAYSERVAEATPVRFDAFSNASPVSPSALETNLSALPTALAASPAVMTNRSQKFDPAFATSRAFARASSIAFLTGSGSILTVGESSFSLAEISRAASSTLRTTSCKPFFKLLLSHVTRT